MKITKFTAREAAIVSDNNGLTQYLRRLQNGRPMTPHSWLYENQSSETTLGEWKKILDRLQEGSDVDRRIYQFDLKQEEKFGLQGGIPPIKEAIQVESFQEEYILFEGNVSEKRTLCEILGVREHSLNYRSFNAVIDDMRERDTLETNSGWPLFTKRDKVKEESIRQAKNGEAWNFPAIILFRYYNHKLRVVWMYPMSMNLVEYQTTQPLQDLITARTPYVTPWLGFEYVKSQFTRLWSQHPYAFGGDTTAMDAHMQRPQLEAVAAAIAPMFKDPKQAVESLLHVSDIDLIVGADAVIRNQQHGVASGSGWTQLSETIFQIIKFDEFIRAKSLPLSVGDGMGIGDDYVWFFDQQPDSAEIVDFWAKDGLPGNVAKQSNESDACTFLQRLFIKGYYSRENKGVLGGIYPTIRALNSLLHPERWYDPEKWDSDMFCVRCYMILENTVDHPLFEDFVKFVVKGQKDLLPFAKQHAARINAAQRRARLLPGLVPTYNQEKREKPMSTYESIRVAKAL